MSRDNLLIIESIDEAKHYVNFLYNKDELFNECAVLSFNPNIQAYLKKNNIHSISTADITDKQNHRAVMDKCEELEDYVKSYLTENNIKKPETYFSGTYYHYFRLICRHLLWNVEIIHKVLKCGSYKRVLAFKYEKFVTLSPWVEDHQLYMGRILEDICRGSGIEFKSLNLELNNVDIVKPEPCERILDVLCNKLSCFVFKMSAAFLSKKKLLFVPSFKYYMDLVCNELIFKIKGLMVCTFYIGKSGLPELAHSLGILFYLILKKKLKRGSIVYPIDFAFPVMTFARFYRNSYDDSVPKKFMDSTVDAIKSGGNEVTIYKGFDLSEILEEKMVNDLFHYMLTIHFQAFGLSMGMRLFNPGYVISQTNFEIYSALGTITKEMNIPSVLISHGSHVYHEDKYMAKEHSIQASIILVGDYKYSAVQSPIANEFASKLIEDKDRIVNIKPTLWGRKVEREVSGEPDSITIIHAGTFKMRHNRRYMFETSDEFVQGVRDLCETIAGNKNLKFIIKFRPDNYELSLESLKALLPESDNISIQTDKPFLEVLRSGDLVVSFSSTTIEEALSNNVPVLLYGGHGRYSHIPCVPFSDANDDILNPVTFVENKDYLMKYMTKLNATAGSYEVADEKFDKYCFKNRALNFTDWFLNLDKNISSYKHEN